MLTGMDRYEPTDRKGFLRIFIFGMKQEDAFNHDVSSYDFVLLLDVIEHFKRPEVFLDSFAPVPKRT